MAKQRYNIGVDNLSYTEPSKTSYVPIPVKEILAFRQQREQDYLTTKNNINLATELKKTLPTLDVSKPLYDEIVTKVDSTLSGITPDNYADKTVDSAQLIHDTVYKHGGKELKDQYDDYTAKAKAISEAKNVRPEILEWKKKQLQESVKPITRDEKGEFVVPTVSSPKLVETQDLFKKTSDLLDKFKSSSKYVKNSDGSVSVDKDIVGKYGITKTEFADEQELYNTALTILSKDPVNAEYLDDEAEFNLYKNPPTSESVASNMSDVAVATFFPNNVKQDKNGKIVVTKPVTKEDIDAFTKGNPNALNFLAKEESKYNQMNAVSQAMANIYGFSKEDKQYFDNEEYKESLKARYTNNVTNAEDVTGPLVIVKPAVTQTIASPVIFDNLKKEEEKLIQDYVPAKTNYDNYIARDKELEGINTPEAEEERNRLKENIITAKEQLERVDANIQYNRQAQDNLVKATVQIAKTGKDGKNVDIEKEYETILPTLSKAVDRQNSANLTNTGYSVNVNKFVKPNSYKNNTLKIDLPEYGEKTLNIYSEENAKRGVALADTEYIVKNGENYTLYSNVNDRAKVPVKQLFNAAVLKNYKPYQLADNPYNAKKDGQTTVPQLQKVPTVDEYAKTVSKLFMNPNVKLDSQELIVKEYATKQAKGIREFAKASDVNVNQTLDYLYVDDQVKKGTAAYNLLRLGVSIDTTLQADANQYKVVNDEGQWEDLPLYLRSKGLSVNDIDFSKLKTSVMLTSDREYGQKLNMPLPLTEDGKKILSKKGDLDLSGTLNVVAVSKAGKDSNFNKKLVDSVYAAYKESFSNTLPSGDQERKAYGLIAFDNSRYSDDFYKLNLYTLRDGATANWTTPPTAQNPNGQAITINAIKRSATPGKLGDNDFFLTTANSIMAYNKKTGITGFVSKADYDADRGGFIYRRQTFASPEDIGSLMGQTMLNIQAQNSNSTTIKNKQVQTSGTSYEVKEESIISTEYKTSTSNIRKTYGVTSKPFNIKDGKGGEITINSRVNPKEMTYLKDEFPNNFKDGVNAYIHSSVANVASTLIKDYKLQITDMFRPAGKSAKMQGAAKQSLHEYGKSFDSRYNEEAQRLLADLRANPEMAKNLGISYAFKHVINGTPHLHIDFN